MDESACPACKAVNDEDAKYCDQCGQPLAEPDKDEGDGDCPACGGIVDDQGGGKGACRRCGLELRETAPPEAAGAAARDGLLPEKLTAAILRLTNAGMPLDHAVAQAATALLGAPAQPAPAGDAAPAAAGEPCPLCGRENAGDAARCAGCGLWFERRHRPGECPSCGGTAAGDKCRCGALLTLPALLELLEPSVKFLCSKCKQPYVASAPSCPDCGGTMVSAARLQEYARSAGEA